MDVKPLDLKSEACMEVPQYSILSNSQQGVTPGCKKKQVYGK